MRDPKRIKELLNHLERVWSDYPDLRLGQLIVIATKPRTPCPEVFYKEDDEVLEGLLEFEEKIRKMK